MAETLKIPGMGSAPRVVIILKDKSTMNRCEEVVCDAIQIVERVLESWIAKKNELV